MNQEIKELLELAARACGRDHYKDFTESGAWCPLSESWWAPHLDDGDGARMEAELFIRPTFWAKVSVESFLELPGWDVTQFSCTEYLKDHNGDRQAARRMASLRVAAEVGRKMKG